MKRGNVVLVAMFLISVLTMPRPASAVDSNGCHLTVTNPTSGSGGIQSTANVRCGPIAGQIVIRLEIYQRTATGDFLKSAKDTICGTRAVSTCTSTVQTPYERGSWYAVARSNTMSIDGATAGETRTSSVVQF